MGYLVLEGGNHHGQESCLSGSSHEDSAWHRTAGTCADGQLYLPEESEDGV